MSKKLLKWMKILAVGVIWSTVYLFALVPMTRRLFYVDLLNPNDYIRLFQAFLDNRWQINSFGSLILLILLLGFVPLWLTGWVISYRKWPSLKSFKRKKKLKITSAGGLEGLPQRKAFVPEKMRTQAAVLLNMSLEEAQQKLKEVASSASSFQGTSTNSTSEADARREADIAQITAATSDYELEVFSNLFFAGERVPLALSTDERAALVWLINEPNETWSVDINDSLEQSDWYGTSRQLPSPAGILTKVCAALKESEPNSEIIPLIVLTSGRILNEAEALITYQAAGIRLAIFGEANGELIPPLTSVLDELFLKNTDEKTVQPELSSVHMTDSASESDDMPKASDTPLPKTENISVPPEPMSLQPISDKPLEHSQQVQPIPPTVPLPPKAPPVPPAPQMPTLPHRPNETV